MSGHHSQRVPSVLFVGQSKSEIGKIITDVTNIGCNAEGVPETQSWPIDCKYYTATINIKTGTLQTIPAAKDLVEALVVLFDPKNESSLGALFAYADQLKTRKPDVCLAVCDNFEGALESYENIVQFCNEYKFELVELSPKPETIASEESANEETVRYESKEEYGATRVLNALLANPWTGMKRKKWTPGKKPGQEEAEAEPEKENSEAKPKDSEAEALANSCADQMATVFNKPAFSQSSGPAPSASAAPMEGGMDDLLTKLKQLKAKTANLSDNDRKKYAERVAQSFAEAMGVDD